MAHINASKTALMIMDFQYDIVSMVDDAPALLQRTQTAREIVRATGASVGYVRVAFTLQDYDSTSPNNKSFATIRESRRLADDSEGSQIHADLTPAKGEFVVTKTRVGAFSTTNLATHLRGRNIDTLILAGIATSGVVLSTVRDAADHDYRLFVLADCCADRNPDVHRILTEDVFPRQSDVITTDDLGGLFT